MFDPFEGFRSPRLTYEDEDRDAWAGKADGPARLNSFDVDARREEQALKKDMVVYDCMITITLLLNWT